MSTVGRHHHEIERTYSPAQGAEVGDLTALDAVAEVGEPRVADLEATYYDTVDLRLTRAGISLRRRTGGGDAGWHLKVPAGEGRDEVHRPLRASRHTPPKPLRDAVLAWTLGAPLQPVAEISTRRTTVDLLAPGGSVLAEVADDETRARRTLDPHETDLVWREIEVELVDGDHDLLEACERHLAERGIAPSDVGRKIERALGDVLPPPEERPRPRAKKPASRVVHARLAEQLEQLRRCESEARRDRPDAVHRLRVASRRLSSALRTFAPLLDEDTVEPLRVGLRRLRRGLGPERDLEVAGERLRTLLDDTDPALVVGPVRARLRREVAARAKVARGARVDELASPEHLALLVGLDRLVADPPWTPLASRRADDVLPPLVGKDARRLRRRAAGATDDEQRHRARVAAKRLRHAAETAAPVLGKRARRQRRAAKRTQAALGVLQDTRLSRGLLLDLAEAATSAGESSFTYGLWHAREQAAAADARQRAAETLDMLKSGTRSAGVAVREK